MTGNKGFCVVFMPHLLTRFQFWFPVVTFSANYAAVIFFVLLADIK